MPDPNDDFYVSWQVRWQKIRGSYAAVDTPLGHIQVGPPGTDKDYTREIKGVAVPVVSHEIGEYQVYPDYREIDKYTGVVRARNFEIFRDRLKQNGMLDQADDFFRASGALAVLCYREDIEAALRTRGFGGFQLLDLQDFSGQGTALVGHTRCVYGFQGTHRAGPVAAILFRNRSSCPYEQIYMGSGRDI